MYCLIYDREQGGMLEFSRPDSVIRAVEMDKVKTCLSEVERSCQQGDFAVGFVTYEAAPAFDEAFVSHPAGGLPLVCFGVFKEFQVLPFQAEKPACQFEPWQATLSESDYHHQIRRVKNYIAEGDTYQVNFTFKLRSRFKGDARQLFFFIQDSLHAEYAAYIEWEDQIICSFSPELFFRLDQGRLCSKPMKGTAPRGLTLAEDRSKMVELAQSPKNQAENIMIVDMIRNDMGRIAETGSVEVTRQFDVERHPYVLQMTSEVVSHVTVPLWEIFKALFPCGSITGAPKVRTMEIIRELESENRGIYTGTIGYVATGGKARFNVAIRSIVMDIKTGQIEYGVGSGIIWDSETNSEYQECLLKAEFLKRTDPDFSLIESLLWDKKEGYFLLQEHLARLAESAEYFDFPFSQTSVLETLLQFQKTIPLEGAKVRLTMDKTGQVKLEAGSLTGVKTAELKVGLAKVPIDSQNRFLYHKTTNRAIYDEARQGRPECDDVILWNEKEEITESCRANVVAEVNGKLVTPPVKCGLLAGTFRNHLLQSGAVSEKIITTRELRQAARIFTVNSVRRWMDAVLIS